jgi:hypothetical protein
MLGTLDWIAIILLVIGGINWLLVGLFKFDLVAAIFGGQAAAVSRIVYVVVGICAVYVIIAAFTWSGAVAVAGG